MEEDQTVN